MSLHTLCRFWKKLTNPRSPATATALAATTKERRVMSNNPTSVTLDVRNSSTNGDGWTNVNVNGAPYSYKYVGGNRPNNDGSVQYGIGGGNAAITLNFASTTDARYQLIGDDAVHFNNDPNGQLSTHGNASRTRVINDSCNGALDGSYKVNVTDTGTSPNNLIPCDPIIKNVPGGGSV